MALIDDLLRAPDATPYYAFRGQFASGAKVVWGTRYVQHPSGLIDGRMAMPADVSEGLPSALGAAPERASTTITLHNADRALDAYMVGGPDVRTEFTGDSWLNLSGKLYLGVVALGQIAEQAISPTLCLNGQPSQQGGTVQLPLATRDELFFGKTKWVVTAKMIRNAQVVDDGERIELYVGGSQVLEPYVVDDFARDVAFATDADDQVIPWAYGVSPIPLTLASPQGRTPILALGWLSSSEPFIGDALYWRFKGATFSDELLIHQGRGTWLFKIRLRLDFGDDLGTRDLWLVGMQFPRWQAAFDDAIHVIPSEQAAIGMPSTRRLNPANIIRQLIVDHSELGSAAVDHAAFDRAAQSFDVPAFGGIYRCDASISELLQHLSQTGYSIWVDVADRVQILSHGAWSADEYALAKTGPLTHIRLSSIAEGTWREYLPVGESERGAAASRVTIEWSSDQEYFWPAQYRQERAPGLHRTQLAQEVEARTSGAWVHPRRADDALSGAGSRRAFPTRRFVATGIGPETRLIPLGSLVRISHPLGSAAGGYEFRLGRLERRRAIPGEQGVELQVEDLGPVEHLRPGKLDDIANWIAHDPSTSSIDLTLLAAGTAKTSKAVFDVSMVGGSLWVFGATDPENRRSYRIDKVHDATTADISPKPHSNESNIPASPSSVPLIDAAWLVMHTHESKGPNYRPEYIRVAGPDGLLPGGDPGYAMMD